MVMGIPARGKWGHVGEPAWKSEYDRGRHIGNYDCDGRLDGELYLTHRLKFSIVIDDTVTIYITHGAKSWEEDVKHQRGRVSSLTRVPQSNDQIKENALR